MNMYSNNQWSFNPAAYHNVPYEQVDWASLAQQWIKMKETLPNTNQEPAPPPAPQISKPAATEPTPTPTATVTQSDIEGGEAPMDMDTKDDDGPNVGVAPSGNWNEWGNWQSQWGWGWSANAGTVPLAETTQSATASVDSKVKSQSNDSIPVLNDVRNFPIIGNTGTCTPQVPSSFNYNNSGGGMIPPIHPKTNYNFDSSFTPVPAKGADSWSKSKNANKQASQKPIPTEQFAVMDATKKKQLPAWIREGLNKMEREKQRKLEQERMMQEKMRMEQMRPEIKEPEPNPLPIYAEIPAQQDRPATPDYVHRSPEILPKPRRRSPAAETSRQRSRLDAPVLRKTKDQIMEESMLKVRRILTELLLEATEKQVHLIAKEEHRRFRVSASAQPIRKSNALTSLTGNLGLDVYDSDDNSSDGERDNDNNDADSDEELQMLIEKKKRDFTLVEDEIERLIEDQEMKERLIAQQDAKDEDDNDDDGNEDDEEDEPRNRKIPDRDTSTPHQRNTEHDKDRPTTNDRADSKPSEDYYRGRRRDDAGNETKQLNGDTKSQEADKTSRQSKKKSKSRSSSSSSSTSTSSSSSDGTSTSESTSSKSDRSTGSSSESRRKSKKSKSHKRNDKKSEREVKKRRDSSESNSEKRSSSRSRYHDRYKRSRRSDSVERKRRRRSPSYHRRSPSYHKSSRREQSSKYKDSPSSSSHTRRRDYSRESKRSRYRSSSRESRYKRR